MKYAFTILIFISPLLGGSACNKGVSVPRHENIQNNVGENDDPMSNTIRIKVGEKVFTATLLDNGTAKAFKARLPLMINMTELNGNEKFFRFSDSLPTDASNPGTINSGDLMLWGSNTMVLFYQTFSTSYSYTRIGKIDNPTGLAAALGSGNVAVIFETQ